MCRNTPFSSPEPSVSFGHVTAQIKRVALGTRMRNTPNHFMLQTETGISSSSMLHLAQGLTHKERLPGSMLYIHLYGLFCWKNEFVPCVVGGLTSAETSFHKGHIDKASHLCKQHKVYFKMFLTVYKKGGQHLIYLYSFVQSLSNQKPRTASS